MYTIHDHYIFVFVNSQKRFLPLFSYILCLPSRMVMAFEFSTHQQANLKSNDSNRGIAPDGSDMDRQSAYLEDHSIDYT